MSRESREKRESEPALRRSDASGPADRYDAGAMRASLEAGAHRLGVALDEDAIRGLLDHLDELRLWAPRLSLVSSGDLGDPRALVERHVLDSLAAVPVIAPVGPRFVDLGSGAGFPGIPVAVALRSPRALLVEPRQKRASFLRAVGRRLPGVGIEVATTRIEDLPADAIGAGFDALLSRATLPIPALQAAALRCLRPGGLLVAFRGPARSGDPHDPCDGVASGGRLRRLPDRPYRVAPGAPELILASWEKVDR